MPPYFVFFKVKVLYKLAAFVENAFVLYHAEH